MITESRADAGYCNKLQVPSSFHTIMLPAKSPQEEEYCTSLTSKPFITQSRLVRKQEIADCLDKPNMRDILGRKHKFTD